MKLHSTCFLLAAMVGMVLSSGILHAQVLTGDPATDDWTALGLSDTTYYIDGAASFDVTEYTTAFTLAASSPLITNTVDGFDWNAGDTIIGVGGVFAAGGNGSLTYNMSGAATTRIVVKYGTSSATWAVDSNSTSLPGYGSLAHGGVGSVLLGTYTGTFSPSNSGDALVPNDSPELELNSDTMAINGDVGRVITFWDGSTLVGFESLLDLTLLNSKYSADGVNVALGDKADLDLQQLSGNVVDSLVQLPSVVESPPAVPEPSAAWLLLAGLAGLGFWQGRRCRAAN
ncbi:MAG TPA: PEP-CTERM sorting domain-containing protein [Candidatus Methylacidiphilales bacterium]|jgi:hypothetical protein|nr:PEP-CTERM sorting domain-containing protein [Candidatus Methylacidiphilales bacterium]